MILNYLSNDWVVQSLFVAGCFITVIVLTAFRKIERHEMRAEQIEREKSLLLEHRKQGE